MHDLHRLPVAPSPPDENVLRRQIDLNKEMLRLPLHERRLRWAEYCKRLAELHPDP
jgi:hypothetical protein